jgi:hypothetical protein
MNKFVQAGKVKQVKATILAPENAGLRIVLNAVGQSGKFDTKLDTLLTKKWLKVREDYRGWFASQQNFKLGCVNNTAVASDIWVVNMLVQDKEDKFSQEGLQAAVKKLADLAKYEKASVHVSTLLTAEIPTLQDLLLTHLVENGIHVYFYEEPVK